MASFAASSTTPTLPELIFPSAHSPAKRLKLSLYRPHNLGRRSSIRILGTRIRAVQREESSTVLDERDRELVTKLNGSVNGNGSVANYTNGSVKVENGNGSLVKYVNGNGNGNANGSVGSRSELEVVEVEEVISQKKSIEEIGQEEAWFKKKGQDQVEVYYIYGFSVP
ncbi:UNVERIFIED_CONTAM: hypothetical protein Sradi_0827900 [Sesamum radiatum]|uniref:Uncharacterized protein n=1 Tax=Sesamum radiatum TaxID=300843 RepID=A0AAW2VQZ1_SESRA